MRWNINNKPNNHCITANTSRKGERMNTMESHSQSTGSRRQCKRKAGSSISPIALPDADAHHMHISSSAMSMKAMLLITTLAIGCHVQGAYARKLAMPNRRKSPPSGTGTVTSSLHGFPSLAEEASNNLQLESSTSILFYRGGSASSNSDNEDEVSLDSEAKNGAANNDNIGAHTDNEEANGIDIDQKVHTEDSNIQVTSTVANHSSEPTTDSTTPPTVETSTRKIKGKKSNAVGDPDGNSSDDESDLEEELLEEELAELDDLEKELILAELEKQRKEMEGEEGFESLVELAERNKGMKRRIELMEEELVRRREIELDEEGDVGEGEEDETDGEIDLDDETEEDDEFEEGDLDEEEEDIDGSSSSTSYHLAGTDVAKEDTVLKRQRKYKRGSIFKNSSSNSKRRRSSTKSSSGTSTVSTPKPPTIPTTISQTTFDTFLIHAFQSMIYLPPPSPRLPSPAGSTSLKNVDISSRRRLDRRTLYHGLLAELGGSHHHTTTATKDEKADGSTTDVSSTKKDNTIDSMIRRRYLDAETSRSLKGALSLACQPKWRERLGIMSTSNTGATKEEDSGEEEGIDGEEMPSWFHRGGVCLFPSNYDEDENCLVYENNQPSQQQQQMQQGMMQRGFMGGQGMNNMGPMGQNMGGNNMDDGTPQGFFGPEMMNDEEGGGGGVSAVKPWKCTMSMQETVAMALSHSLSCGMAMIDDEALASVRESVDMSLAELAAKAEEGSEGQEEKPTINPEELRNSALLRHLVRLANAGKLEIVNSKPSTLEGQEDDESASESKASRFGKISHRMKRDMELGLDDSNDDLAVESLRLMQEDEKHWFEPIVDEEETVAATTGDDTTQKPLPLVLFLRSDSSASILKSKSAVEALAQECVKKDGIHMLMLGGKGIDASSTSLPNADDQFFGDMGNVGMAQGRMNRQQPSMFTGNQSPQQPQQGGRPFAFMSNFPPGSPEFNAQMQQQQQPQWGGFNPNQMGPGQPGAQFSANNANASGQNDPEGSKRFNIFLARTVDPTGRPQIMGTIAPPQAGNLFPLILANMAKENLQKMEESGIDEDNEQQMMFRKQMEDLVGNAERHIQQMQQQGQGPQEASDDDADGVDGTKAAFFNATISSPFGAEIFNQINPENGEDGQQQGQYAPPPEHVRRAIQDAMSGVIERLAQMSASAAANSSTSNAFGKGGIPMNIARAFSQVLSNENLRRGISENLSRAAPALVDPRCQGVMLSVYVPPGQEHPNKGMMPGDQYNQQQGVKQRAPEQGVSQQQQADKGGDNVPLGMGGWLNKILSSSEKGKQQTSEDEEDASADVDESVAEETSDTTETEQTPSEKKDSSEVADSTRSPNKPSKRSSRKGSKREKNLDRARTLAVAAAALAGAKRNRKEKGTTGSGNNTRMNIKLTPEQKAQRNLLRLQTLCKSIPVNDPIDPVRSRAWGAWGAREEGSVIFRKNRSALSSQLSVRDLSIDVKSGTKGAGIVLRQMMSVRPVGSEEMEDIIRCAVEIEAGKSQRHHESPWGVAKPAVTAAVNKPLATDKSLVNFLQDGDDSVADNEMEQIKIHPNSLESALSLICGVNASPGSQGSSASSGVMASHRSKEDLTALAQDKHERALIPNCVSPQDIGVSYDMIGGLSEVKELLRQSVTYPLKFPHLYSEGIAREAVKGVLLFGPPGTGKTMLAKAVATEGGASFLSVDASSVENKWLGESEKNAKAVFTLARRLAPCVIFIDEVDSLLSSREGSSDDSAHGTLTSVKTTMMSEWDGLNSGTNGKGDAGSDRVVVIGSTNRPFDLDEAVLRRFPRRILVDLPDLETRREILEVTLAENRLGADVNLTMIAERLEGYTGSDLKEVCREAVVQISHEQARMLDRGELLDEDDEDYLETAGSGFQMLRPVTMKDFESAMRKLKRSVSETGRELAKVWDWNDEYGEIKKTNKRDVLPQMMNMFL